MHFSLKNKVQSELVRNSARLLSANVVAQAIGLLVYPILTRMYSPEDFGLLNLFMSIGGIFVLISTADYQNAIVLPKEDHRARALVQLCGCLLLAMVAVLVLSIPFSNPIARLFKAPNLACCWWLMPLYVGGLSGWAILSNYYIRRKSFRRISVYQMSQSVLNAGGKLGFGALGFLSGGMIVSSILAPILAILVSLFKGGRALLSDLFRIDKPALHAESRAYRNFPLYSMPRSLVNTLSGNLPFLLLTPLFGLTELGYFGMAFTLSFRPIQIIVQSIYQVLFQRTAQLVNDKKQIGYLIYKYVVYSFCFLIISFSLLYFILPWLTVLLLGNSWYVSGEYIRILLPWLLLVCITTSINFIPDIFSKQNVMFGVEIVYLVMRITALLVGVHMNSFYWAICLYSLTGFIVLSGQLIWFLMLIKRYDNINNYENNIK